MMFLFLALQAAAPTPPADWSAVPQLRLSATPDYAALMTRFVRDEVVSNRCAARPAADGKVSVKIDMVLLVAPSGDVLRIVPRAINCPTVEQFAAGVVQKAVRGNWAGAAPANDSWYRTAITISWGS